MQIADSTFTSSLPTAGTAAYGTAPSATFATTVHDILSAVFSIMGVIFLVLTIYAGMIWMTAQGDSKKVQKAKDILSQSVIGLIICLAAYGITTWVFTWALVVAI